jgi:hypothetical protein
MSGLAGHLGGGSGKEEFHCSLSNLFRNDTSRDRDSWLGPKQLTSVSSDAVTRLLEWSRSSDVQSHRCQEIFAVLEPVGSGS